MEINILKTVKEKLGNLATEIELEGSEIIVYTNNKEFFLSPAEKVKPIVEEIKKRIEVRMHPSLCTDENFARSKIQEIVPKEAGLKDIYFEKQRSLVFIEVEKPGLAIGKGGEVLKRVKNETLWTVRVERIPTFHSEVVYNVRKLMHSEVNFRKEFLSKVGKRIFEVRQKKRNWIRIVPLGGYREVGRSTTLVETPHSTVMIDCGVKAGIYNENGYPILNTREFDISGLDAIIVSHAHIDHIGFIPALYELGYDGPLYMTTPTLDLFVLLLTDFIDVMQKNAVNPIFTSRGVKEAVKRTITLDYNEVTDITNDIRLTFQNAGHILGSSLVHLHIGDGLHNIVYALDQKFDRTTLLDPAYTDFQRVETLIIESTYGSKNDVMPKRREAEKQLIDYVNKVMERGGIVLIPSFSVERAQDIMAILALNDFEYPVYIDGMIWDATSIYTTYPEYLNRKIQKMIFSGNDPFKKDIFKKLTTKGEREKAWEDKPSVIISTSGMLTGGPVLEHLKALAEDDKNMMIFVGYQGEGTLGRKIQRGLKEVQLYDNGKLRTYKINLEVVTLNGLSGHSDRRQLMAYIGNLKAKPKRVIVAHGEEKKSIEFGKTIEKVFKIETTVPRNLESIRVL
ncbi:MAG: beta-CASP ribonuclease aCPSF1 [Candidatus Aenigmarchaeota archaeon]|nr:beta-CASP ribonuclease aCPSF1 [Candidatus Aenigmarchaeota archaeon]